MMLSWHIDNPPFVWSNDVLPDWLADLSLADRRMIAIRLVAATNGVTLSSTVDVPLNTDGDILRVDMRSFLRNSVFSGLLEHFTPAGVSD